MHKLASPQDLQTELRRLLTYANTEAPSRSRIAATLNELADGVMHTMSERSRRLAATSIWKAVQKSKDVANLGSISLIAYDDEWAVYGVETEGGQGVVALKDGNAKDREDAKAQAEAAAKTILRASLARL